MAGTLDAVGYGDVVVVSPALAIQGDTMIYFARKQFPARRRCLRCYSPASSLSLCMSPISDRLTGNTKQVP